MDMGPWFMVPSVNQIEDQAELKKPLVSGSLNPVHSGLNINYNMRKEITSVSIRGLQGKFSCFIGTEKVT